MVKSIVAFILLLLTIEESEGVICAIVLILWFGAIGSVLLISSRKTIKVYKDKIMYYPIIGNVKIFWLRKFLLILRKNNQLFFTIKTRRKYASAIFCQVIITCLLSFYKVKR